MRFVNGHKPRTLALSPDKYVVDEESGCWIWQRKHNGFGYGLEYEPSLKRMRGAHKNAWERVHGPVPEGLELDHLCGRRDCVNPEHLEPVTRTENIRRSSRTKLCPEQAHEIRDAEGSYASIARRYGVTGVLVSKIKRGKIWKDV